MAKAKLANSVASLPIFKLGDYVRILRLCEPPRPHRRIARSAWPGRSKIYRVRVQTTAQAKIGRRAKSVYVELREDQLKASEIGKAKKEGSGVVIGKDSLNGSRPLSANRPSLVAAG